MRQVVSIVMLATSFVTMCMCTAILIAISRAQFAAELYGEAFIRRNAIRIQEYNEVLKDNAYATVSLSSGGTTSQSQGSSVAAPFVKAFDLVDSGVSVLLIVAVANLVCCVLVCFVWNTRRLKHQQIEAMSGRVRHHSSNVSSQ